MTRYASVFACIGLLVVGAACGPRGDLSQADPNRPAVVKAPALILPSDTMKPDTMTPHRERMELVSRELLGQYGLVAFSLVNADRRLLASIYDTSIVLAIGDSTWRGRLPVISALTQLARSISMKEFSRASHHVESIGDTYLDSGSYVIVAQRAGAKVAQQSGTYVSRWRLQPNADVRWVLLEDRLSPPSLAPPTKR